MAEEKVEEQKEEIKDKIGEVSHFFDKLQVAIIKLSAPLKVGDKVRIKGATTDFEQNVDSIQLDHESLEEAKSGQEVGIKVSQKTREGDGVFKG